MPLLYRDVQSAFQGSEQAFTASVKSYPKGAQCPFDASSVPQFPVGYWYLSPEQVRSPSSNQPSLCVPAAPWPRPNCL